MTNSLTSDEHEERLKQAALTRHSLRALINSGNVDELETRILSLLDSQVAKPPCRDFDCMTKIADETLWCATCAARAEYLRGQSDATVRMREKCLERVKALRAGWLSRRNGFEPLSKMRNRFDAAFCAASEIIGELESLTLDNGGQEQKGVEDGA